MKAIYIAGTHWDREWYKPFQEFRRWLVELIDGAIDLMEKDEAYACFHLDGQAVVLQDFLEIRPERREVLIRLLKEGRLVAGPWYDLPDEWLVSGESFVRNLMMGMRVCRELGFEPMSFGYTPDQFGHIAALPMIMTGMGLDAGICWRGTQDTTHPAFFTWVGPDGSRMPTFRLYDRGSYAPFKGVRDGVKKEGFTDEAYQKLFGEYYDSESKRVNIPLMVLLDAIDHDCPDPDMPRIFNDLKKRWGNVEFVWGSLNDVAAELVRHADSLPEFCGELREPAMRADEAAQYLIVHTISSRYPLKRRNAQCQTLLERWAEPMALMQAMAGTNPMPGFLTKAWEYLLRNHPHDSICGCSVDQVHRDMMYRFDQSELLAEGVLKRAFTNVLHPSDDPAHAGHLAVVNPVAHDRTGVQDLVIPFDKAWATAYIDGLSYAEHVNRFKLVTSDGNEVPCEVCSIDRNVTWERLTPSSREDRPWGDLYHVAAELPLPATGYTGLRVETSTATNRPASTMMTGPLSASNGVLTLSLNPNGTAALQHTASAHRYDGLFLYEDCGDGGDGWTFGHLVNDIVFRSPGSRVTTAIEHEGALRTVFRIERTFELPVEQTSSKNRSSMRAELRVTDRITLDKGKPYARVQTVVSNPCSDHRFRVLFPTDLKADRSFADSPFALVERSVVPPEGSHDWHERWNPEKPFTSWFGLQDGHNGLAVLALAGPFEYEVKNDPSRALAMTLFRATSMTVATEGEPDGQLIGDMTFDYLLMPFHGAFDPVMASRFLAEEQVRPRCIRVTEPPATCSFVKAETGVAVVSAVKRADSGEDGIVRLWNPDNDDVREVLRFGIPVTKAWLCNLNEEILDETAILPDGTIPVLVPAGGLATLRFAWTSEDNA